jgi:hypothetical protein
MTPRFLTSWSDKPEQDKSKPSDVVLEAKSYWVGEATRNLHRILFVYSAHQAGRVIELDEATSDIDETYGNSTPTASQTAGFNEVSTSSEAYSNSTNTLELNQAQIRREIEFINEQDENR